MLVVLVLLQGLCPSLVMSQAEAESPAPALSWVRERGAEACIASVDLARKVEAMLGRMVFVSAAEADLVVEGYVRSREPLYGPQEFRALLMVSDASGKILGSRELTSPGPDCSELDEALALVIAVTLYPDSGLAGESLLPRELNAALDTLFPDAAEGPDLDTLPSKTPAQRPTPRRRTRRMRPEDKPEKKPAKGPLAPKQGQKPSPSARDELVGAVPMPPPSLRVGAGGVAGIGLLPGLTPGVRASVLFGPSDVWPMGLSGTVWMSAHTTADRSQSGRAQLRLFYAGPCVCPLSQNTSWFGATACLGVQVGALTGSTDGFVEDSNSARPVVNVDIDAQVAARLFDPVWLRLGMTATLPMLQHTFLYQDWRGIEYELFQMAQAGLSAELGMELRF